MLGRVVSASWICGEKAIRLALGEFYNHTTLSVCFSLKRS